MNTVLNSENEKTLRNLGVLSALTQNDKINTKEDIFSIYVPTSLRGLTRMLYGESRDHNISRIQNCARDAKQYISSILNEIDSSEEVDSSVMKRINNSTQTKMCNRMMNSLKDSVAGLSALQITYKDDASCVTQLEILINEINDFLQTTHHIAKTSPVLERFK